LINRVEEDKIELHKGDRSRPTFGQWLLAATRSLGKKFLAFRDGFSSESNTLLGVQNRALPYKTLHSSSTTIYLVEGNLVDDLGAVLSAWKQKVRLSLCDKSRATNTHFRRAFICSIFSGRSSAKRSFRV
jgi:hypothetical protein